jgi:amidohydrolase
MEYEIELRRYFHQYPEPSMEEYETAAKIETELTTMGIPHRRVGKTGVLGIVTGAGTGDKNVVILRADIDALRIQDEKDAPYRSERAGVAHACGHDAHIAALLGAARELSAHSAAFSGEVRLVFQPGEEIGKGAEDFIVEGVAEGACRVFGVHMASDLPCGTIGLTPGPNNASADYFKITVRGKSAHISTPERGIDAIAAVCGIVTALQTVATRQVSPVNPVVIGVGRLNAGDAYNIVAEKAVLEGTLRVLLPEVRAELIKKIETAVEKAANVIGANTTIEWRPLASPLVNPPEVCAEVQSLAREVFGVENIVVNRPFSFAADNFAMFQAHVPGVYAYIGSSNPAFPNTCVAHHNAHFDIDEQSVIIAARLYKAYALHVLKGVL